MGNRAVITTAPYSGDNVGIYVHWNGGRESVEGFLSAARSLQLRSPVQDPAYAMARLCQIIANYFGGTLSIGIGKNSDLDTDNGDNGVWKVGHDWHLVDAPKQDFSVDEADAIRDRCVDRMNLIENAA